MVKITVWLVLTLLSCGGLTTWFLYQQHEGKSAVFRILYRDVTVKLAQHDAVMPLLPTSKRRKEQNIFP